MLMRAVVISLLSLTPVPLLAGAVAIPPGTPVFAETEERVTSRVKKDGTDVGDAVPAHVWRDVVIEGSIVIKAGAPMFVRVSEVKKAKLAGIKGKLELEAVSAQAIDGSQVLLDGGYDKSGHGRKGLSISLAACVAWPLIFIHGKSAVLDSGTVFDAETQSQTSVLVGDSGAAPQAIHVGDGPTLAVTVLYDETDPEGKDKSLPLTLEGCRLDVTAARVVTVDGEEVQPIPIVLGAATRDGDCAQVHGQVEMKELGKHFRKGINRFEVEAGGKRDEVVLEVEL